MADASVSARAALWRGEAPLVLASKSEVRRAMLEAAGLNPHVMSAELDERALEERFLVEGGRSDDLAAALARAKALTASRSRPEAYCLGADQTLTLGDRLMHKPRDLVEAAQSLAILAGRRHRLTAAFSVAREGRTLVVDADHADLQMRALDGNAIEHYLQFGGPGVLRSVGAYQLEGLGVHLFDRVEGDYTTILGLPMFRLLRWLRRQKLISL
ncbi:MAG: Maf family protein [Hyphomicrobiales bacterium]|nr:Maf family protein [Hyphomicrobiales bacterium]